MHLWKSYYPITIALSGGLWLAKYLPQGCPSLVSSFTYISSSDMSRPINQPQIHCFPSTRPSPSHLGTRVFPLEGGLIILHGILHELTLLLLFFSLDSVFWSLVKDTNGVGAGFQSFFFSCQPQLLKSHLSEFSEIIIRIFSLHSTNLDIE